MKDELQAEITAQQLRELERNHISTGRRIVKRIVTVLPILVLAVHLLEYNFVSNYGTNTCTNVYNMFLLILISGFAIAFILSFFLHKVYDKLHYKAAFFTVLFLLMMAYDYATLKRGVLVLPYFPWIDNILNAIISDRAKLFECLLYSLHLLFSGFFKGALAGLICGIGAGWSKKIYYWVYPLARVLGAIPTTTYMPIVLMLVTSLFAGSSFIIALGVWFPVTLTAMTGVASVSKHYYEVAQTLGTGKARILFRVVIPAALPNIFNGMTQGLSVACLTLVVAEMMGGKTGLGWYVNWQKGWADFAKMYGAIFVICLTFIAATCILNLIKKRAIRWQKGND